MMKMQPIDLTQIIVAFVTFIGSIYATYKQGKGATKTPATVGGTSAQPPQGKGATKTPATVGDTSAQPPQGKGATKTPATVGGTSAQPRQGIWRMLLVVCILLLAANLAFLFWRSMGTPQATITYPAAMGSVALREVIRGTSRKLPEDQALWILAYPQAIGNYYPQNAPVQKLSITHKYFVTLCYPAEMESASRRNGGDR